MASGKDPKQTGSITKSEKKVQRKAVSNNKKRD